MTFMRRVSAVAMKGKRKANPINSSFMCLMRVTVLIITYESIGIPPLTLVTRRRQHRCEATISNQQLSCLYSCHAAHICKYQQKTPDKVAVRANGIAYWASAEGQRMKGLGFKDWIYNYGSFNKTTRAVTEHGIFSCAEGKWYRDAEHFFTAHGLKQALEYI